MGEDEKTTLFSLLNRLGTGLKAGKINEELFGFDVPDIFTELTLLDVDDDGEAQEGDKPSTRGGGNPISPTSAIAAAQEEVVKQRKKKSDEKKKKKRGFFLFRANSTKNLDSSSASSLFGEAVELTKSSKFFATSVQHNTVTPAWNESHDFQFIDHSQIFVINAFDKNEREYDPDIFVGQIKITIGKLILSASGNGGQVELEMLNEYGQPTGIHVTIGCEMV